MIVRSEWVPTTRALGLTNSRSARDRRPPAEPRAIVAAIQWNADALERRGELRSMAGALRVAVDVLGANVEHLRLRVEDLRPRREGDQ